MAGSPTLDVLQRRSTSVTEGGESRSRMGRVRKLFRLVREGRVDQLFRYAFEVIPRGLCHLDLLYVIELTEPNPAVRRPRSLRVRRVDARDVEDLDRAFPRGGPGAFAARLAAGHEGFVCEAAGGPVAMLWVDPGVAHPEPEKFCRFAVPPDAVWAYDLWIAPEWRLSGAMVALVDGSFRHVRQELGRCRVAGYASWHNRESLEAHRSFGYRVVGWVALGNVVGLRLFRWRRVEGSGRTRTHMGFRSTPTIALLSTHGPPGGGNR